MLVTCTKPDIDQLHRTHLFRRQIKGLDFSTARGSCAKQLEPISFRQIEYSSTQSLGRCIFNGEANVSVIQRLGSVLVDCIAAALQLVGLSPARRFYSAHRFSVRERKVIGAAPAQNTVSLGTLCPACATLHHTAPWQQHWAPEHRNYDTQADCKD